MLGAALVQRLSLYCLKSRGDGKGMHAWKSEPSEYEGFDEEEPLTSQLWGLFTTSSSTAAASGQTGDGQGERKKDRKLTGFSSR